MPRWSDAATPRQLEVHATMLAYQQQHGMPPTLRELNGLFGFTSTNAARTFMVALEKRGLVRHRPGAARGWVALQPQPQEGTQP